MRNCWPFVLGWVRYQNSTFSSQIRRFCLAVVSPVVFLGPLGISEQVLAGQGDASSVYKCSRPIPKLHIC